MTETGLLQEIENELQRQHYEKLWQLYGKYIIGGAFAIVLATAAYTGWRAHRNSVEQTDTSVYLTHASDISKTPEQKIAAYLDMAQKTKTEGPAVFARLQAAAIALRQDDFAKAGEILNALATDAKVDTVLRQYADLLYVQSQMDNGDPAVLLARLQPLMHDTAWRAAATEYAGYLTLKLGKKAEAQALFAKLADSPEAPTTLAERARRMAGWIAQTE